MLKRLRNRRAHTHTLRAVKTTTTTTTLIQRHIITEYIYREQTVKIAHWNKNTHWRREKRVMKIRPKISSRQKAEKCFTKHKQQQIWKVSPHHGEIFHTRMPWSDGVQPNFGYYTFHQTRQARLEHNEKVKTCEETMFTPPPHPL